MTNPSYDADVLVVGAGPVGLTLALDLARRDVRVRVVDRAPSAFLGSRAKGIQPRTLEVFDDLGIVDEAIAAGGEYPPMGVHLGPLTIPWRMYRHQNPTPPTPYPNVLLLPQSRTAHILRRALERHQVAVEFGTEVREVYQDEHGATAVLASGPQLRARYLVGADGGASAVRKSSDLRFEGTTDDTDKMIIADATIDGLSRDRWHVWRRTAGFVGACPLPHSSQFQVMIRLRPEENPDLSEPALAARFRDLVGGTITLRDVTWVSIFRPNVRLVEQYRRGRILVCGDAAHVHTPAGAQGLNTGVQDAYNLGWKLGQVLAGASDTLLDSYGGERRPVAAQVLGRSSELYEGLRRPRASKFTRSEEDRQLTISYHGGPLAPADSPRTTTLRVGDRAPDGPISGPATRLFDLYRGPHFTLLGFGERAAMALPMVSWPDRGAGLTRYAVPEDGGPDGVLAQTYGITEDTQLLIRPDGYIAHIDTGDWAASLAFSTRDLAPANQEQPG
ncbi:MAG TPA: FAD-dependent monooxygenase [Pseudonocardia sp.]|uniref:FAD-dependent monooxygenase n=1 Tax=Pseudonocardia sp. TaxID=60912 RepID=UPI002CD3D62E|nr:FAD-dependent monooxygenase [Pseudonocardia sp.]HTF49910.1 FAD-dependent monooxygenase [Pseudonocardia sp.]